MTLYIHRGSEGRYVFVPVSEATSAISFYESAGFSVEIE